MGGRSRESRTERADSFAFISDLSNDRLNAYGNYSSAGILNNNAGTITAAGIPKNTLELNHRAADEYLNRTGVIPAWDLRHHDENK